MCAVTGAVAPAQQPQVRPALPAEIQKAQKRVRHAWQFIAFIGALSVVLGTVAELGNIDLLQNYVDWYAVVEGAIFLVLAYFVRRGSLIALGIAIGLYALDTVALFASEHCGTLRLVILRRHRRSLQRSH